MITASRNNRFAITKTVIKNRPRFHRIEWILRENNSCAKLGRARAEFRIREFEKDRTGRINLIRTFETSCENRPSFRGANSTVVRGGKPRFTYRVAIQILLAYHIWPYTRFFFAEGKVQNKGERESVFERFKGGENWKSSTDGFAQCESEFSYRLKVVHYPAAGP